MRILAKDMKDAAQRGEKGVRVCGWVHRVRELGALSFVLLRDRSGIVQLVLNEKCAVALESVIAAEGEPALNEKAPGGAELRVAHLECISRAAADLPFQVNGDPAKTSLEAILDNRLLSLRNPKIRAIFKVQAAIVEAFSAHLRAQDFTEIKTSKLVAGSTEGGAELFHVEYFDKKVCLAQSPQFYKQTMVASGLERVFEVAPAYRAEKHDTPRHLNEYVSLDVEMAFIESERDLIELEKGILAHIFEEVNRKCAAELALWGAAAPTPESVERSPIVGYEEAVNIANEGAARTKGGRIFDLNPEAERHICEWAEKEHGSALAFVNEFPRRYRPFYTYPLDATRTMSFDALFRGLEITTGGRRQHDYAAFLETLPKFGLKAEDFEGGYLTLLKYGCPPHGGFAIGCERLTARILGLANVKEASLFPRDRKRISP
ncbi:MAG: aspartate--tRNA(Asn) ligase [Spirochaetaceae bacterium]|jgi:nondiscriminating aspartyl-tRNA synthetase|nr:aspartate--tRNA(Asn) ligase [Spirochaetaceae bacterium]